MSLGQQKAPKAGESRPTQPLAAGNGEAGRPEGQRLSPLALLSVADSRVMDAQAERLSSALPEELMQHAGSAGAHEIMRHYAPCRVLVACGPGNNGGDGYVLARILRAQGWRVEITPALPPQTPLARAMAARWKGAVVPFSPQAAAEAELVVDAVFGAGLSRPVSPEVAAFFAAADRIVALDLPTGVNGDTGQLMGEVARCERTVAFVRRRPGHFLLPGAEKCGFTRAAEIGMPARITTGFPVRCWRNEPGLWRLPRQHPLDNKYTRGVVNVCGGTVMPGAALLATEGARRSGCGMARIASDPAHAGVFRNGPPGIIVDTAPLAELLTQPHRKYWVCGPGLLPQEAGTLFPVLLEAHCCVVADAGTLDWAREDPQKLRGAAVLTPHDGEFARVFGPVGPDRIESARKAASLVGSVVVLKGYTTVIAAPDGRVALNVHATPALATAGSGDVLSGTVGTCLAAGLPPWEAACAAVWLHGEAGRRAAWSEGGWPIAEDIVAQLGNARGTAEKGTDDPG
ncbi:NAD(P)H-hydrate dehydratase [Oecophyllibacter saccharovorans]|uniref:Bifunctional NAD(P)H-hydrate repair enzyme n=1 Tax=Oecophyllibacter saccharovorans TaxID=2558360 RepID=A0A506UR36_9PROT|nr:NAD(P)H-hydrate dehydratase [Oecophyllibacter saccharovorans]TPW35762.1 NAD(P)H-hydrate dehydratase [Oecophyllibacter saccharovorans]